jgi:tetratricopeptide (TPR) repeat protein
LGDLDGALRTGTRGLEIARRLGDLELRELMARAVQNAHYHRGEYDRVIELASETHDPYWLTTSNAHLGRFAEATGHETEAIRLAVATQMDTLGIAQTYYSAASFRLIKGDWTNVRARLERAITECRTGNIALMLSVLVALSAWALVQLDEAGETLTALRESEPLLEQLAASGIVGNLSWAYHALGRGCFGLGQLDEARRLGHHAVELAPNRPGYVAYAQHLLGAVSTHPERFDAVLGEAHYGRALALAEPRGMRPLIAHCHLGLGKLYRQTGDHVKADEHLGTARTMYGEMDMRFYLAQAEAARAGGEP